MALIFRRLKPTAASASTKLIVEELLTHAHKAGPVTQRQLIDANQLQRLSLTLDRPHLYKGQSISTEAPPEGTPIPPGYHLAYFTPAALPDELGVDGTDRSYSPSKPYTRRMWAGGELSWDVENRLRVGEQVTETTKLLSADAKVTRTGEEMIMVGVGKTFENKDGIALVDKRDWVFRKELLEPTPVRCLELPQNIPLPEPTGPEVFSRDFLQSPVTLFRFSALTFNAHKIHYSRPWCRDIEGHRDVVVHGPLNLINMLDLWRDAQPDESGIVPKSIRYRATAPIYVNERYRGLLEQRQGRASIVKLWGSDGQGGVMMAMGPLRVRTSGLRKAASTVATSQTRSLSLHEYQAQGLLSEYGIPVPKGYLCTSGNEVKKHVSNHGGQAVAKAQILAGGRRKGTFENGYRGGVQVVTSPEDGERIASKMLGQNLITKQTIPEGLPVDKIYVVEKLDFVKEYYLAITVDRELSCPVLIMTEGGTSVEQLAASNRSAVVKVPLKYDEGISPNIISNIRKRLGFSDKADIASVLQGLYRFFKEKDASLVEINPLITEEGTGRLICADSKVSIDNAAATRQSQVFELRDRSQEMDVELEAEKHGLVYVQLEGNIGCLVNGAGLAMATNDAVAHFGGKCANFLDGGGQATKETMLKAFELLLSDKRVNTLLVNIYGGIVRCDMIAESIVAAAKNFKDVPVVVRLQGTNSADGQRMIAESGLKLFAEDEFGDAVHKAIQLAGSSIDTASTKVREIKMADAPSIVEKSGGGHSAVRHFSTASRPRSTDGKRSECYSRRMFSTTSFRSSYSDTTRNLAIGPQIRVIYQGFTGKAATKNAQETLKYGTHIVGGVSPNKGGQNHLGLPVYSTVREAAEYLQPNATAVFVPALSAAAAITSAIEAQIPLIVSVAEHIPLHDMLRVHSILRTQSRSRLVGPNCPGIISPVHACRIGIMPHLQYAPGIIGIVSRSGTLSYEAVGATTRAGLGQSLCIGVGGDMLPGTSLKEGLSVLLSDENTEGVVLLGEIGGEAELEAAAYLSEWRAARPEEEWNPVVAMVTGRTAPRGKTMGHAGAIAGGGASAEEKIRALERAGAVVAVHPGEIGRLMKEILGEKGVLCEVEKGGEMGKRAVS